MVPSKSIPDTCELTAALQQALAGLSRELLLK